MPGSRSYTAGRFGIEVEAAKAGFAESVGGGQAFAEVVEEKAGTDKIVHKHIAGVKYEDVELTVGANMADSFYDWIASVLDRKSQRKNGAVSFQDYAGAEKEHLSWFHGMISEIAFPAADAADKEPGRMTVKIAPEYTKREKSSGATWPSTPRKAQKSWQPRNFRLTIKGVDCSHVRKVDALTITQRTVQDSIGELREHQSEPAVLAIPNVVVTVAEAHAADFVAWHEDFVIKGNNDSSQEKEGTLEFLSANLKDVIFTLKFRGLGIFRISAFRTGTEAASASALEVHMYCEEMSFEYVKSAPPVVQPPTQPDAATVLVSALREVLDNPLDLAADARRPEHVAARLRASIENGNSATDVSRSSERGRRLGADWARERASLEELEQVAATRRADWTDLALREGHSLISYLQKAGVVPESHDGPLTLERDPFVEELVDGAADVYEEVRPHLARER